MLFNYKTSNTIGHQSVSSVVQSCPTLWDPMDCSMPGFPVHHQQWSLLKLMYIELMRPSNHLILCHPLLLLPSIFPSVKVFLTSQFFPSVTKVLELQPQHQSFQWIFRTYFFQDRQDGSPCNPRGSQASSATAQFKSINSSVLSFLYGPTLTSIHDYWRNHSFDWKELCWQSNISAF